MGRFVCYHEGWENGAHLSNVKATKYIVSFWLGVLYPPDGVSGVWVLSNMSEQVFGLALHVASSKIGHSSASRHVSNILYFSLRSGCPHPVSCIMSETHQHTLRRSHPITTSAPNVQHLYISEFASTAAYSSMSICSTQAT